MNISIPGHLLMQAPEITLQQAIQNIDAVISIHVCNRQTRMGLERSLSVLSILVEQETARMIADQKAAAELAKAKAELKAKEGEKPPADADAAKTDAKNKNGKTAQA